MPKFTLELRCGDMEGPIEFWTLMNNIERHYVTLACSNCAMESEQVYFGEQDEVEVPGGRGVCNLLIKCKGCERTNNVSIVERGEQGHVRGADQWTRGMLTLECRGVQPVAYHLLGEDAGGQFAVSCSDGATLFENVALDDDWAEYDEKADESVGIYDVECRFSRL